MSVVLASRTVLVLGARKTGSAVARFLVGAGANVLLADRDEDGFEEERAALDGQPVEWHLGSEAADLVARADLVVPSPGIPADAPALRAALDRGVPVLSEVELAARFLDAPIYAVTGTNGKSTTTELLGRMLSADGRKVFVGGNLGTPLVTAVGGDWEAVVAEISSFQLEWVERFAPRVGIFLNLTDDHLERYESFEAYGRTKARLFAAQGSEDWAILAREDPWVWALRNRVDARVVSFGRDPVEYGASLDGDQIRIRMAVGHDADPREVSISLAGARIFGRHVVDDVMAAAIAAVIAGVSESHIQDVVDSFQGLPHRLEVVREHRGVRFIDDSKGTNVGAVARSLEAVPGRVILLAGGVDKGGSYDALRPLVREKVKRLVLFGEAAARIRAELGGETDTVGAASMAEAVALAWESAAEGDTVLLSPACASFDMFRDYADRGRQFQEAVDAL